MEQRVWETPDGGWCGELRDGTEMPLGTIHAHTREDVDEAIAKAIAVYRGLDPASVARNAAQWEPVP